MTTEAAALTALRTRIDTTLSTLLDATPGLCPRLNEAIGYAVLGDGKRIRPLLTLAAATSLGARADRALLPACAVELVHAYSLIHDDLPAMDNDDLRRGRPTVHKAYDDATAILAGDALQALAFETLGRSPFPATTRLAMITCLARAAGANGMVGGQAIDMESTGRALDRVKLEQLHDAKTGALLRAAVEIGGLAAGAPESILVQLRIFGARIGLAFQVVDDLLDVTETTAGQGKTAGGDARLGKNTFPALLGIPASRAYAATLHQEAHAALTAAGVDGGLLADLARTIIARRH
jgi:geranylgeranyl diphosphate synthase type II